MAGRVEGWLITQSVLCDEMEETNLHAVWDCVEAKKVWKHFVPPHLEHKFHSLPLKEWVLWNLSSVMLHNVFEEWRNRFAVICWPIWRWRNEVIFNESCLNEHSRMEVINQSLEKTNRAHNNLNVRRGTLAATQRGQLNGAN